MSENCRIQILVDFEPNLDNYPADIKTKLDAMEMEVASVMDGIIGVEDLISFADVLDFSVIKVNEVD